MRAAGVILLLSMAACTAPSPGTCSPSSCKGCCSAQDVCETGSADSACGSNGAACDVCVSGQSCTNGACASGAGGGAGGGSAAGGGAGGGSGGSGGGAAPVCGAFDGRFRGYSHLVPVMNCAVVPADGGTLPDQLDFTRGAGGALQAGGTGITCTANQNNCAVTVACMRTTMPGSYDYAFTVTPDLQSVSGTISLSFPPNCEKATGTTFLFRQPDAGMPASTFAYRIGSSNPYVTYTKGAADVKTMTATVVNGMTTIEFRKSDDTGFSFVIDGSTAGAYGLSNGTYIRHRNATSTETTTGTSGPQNFSLTTVGAVGQPITGDFQLTFKLTGCMSCPSDTYSGHFSIVRN